MIDLTHYIVFTKDGRRYSNGIIATHDDKFVIIITDYGNQIKVTTEQFNSSFWIGPQADNSHKHYNEKRELREG